MSSTHRRKIARALAKATGMTYQQALAAVLAAAENNLLPHALDEAGIAQAVDILAAAQEPLVAPHEIDATGTPDDSPIAGLDPLTSFLVARDDRERLAAALARPHGLIVITGLTATGKTTAFYDTLTALAHSGLRVTSVEDIIWRRIEVPNLTQWESDAFGGRAGTKYAATIKNARRGDPDVLGVGEIRHKAVALHAADAALTGTLTLATMHAHSAAGVVNRLLSHVEPVVLADALSCVVVVSHTSVGHRAEVVTITDEMRERIRGAHPEAPQALSRGHRGTGRDLVAQDDDDRAGVLRGVTERSAPSVYVKASAPRIDHPFVAPAAGHLLVTGPTGSGKTVIAREAMRVHRDHGDRILLIDTGKGGVEYDHLADEVATTTDEAFAMLTRLYGDERRTLLVIEDLTISIPPPAAGEHTGMTTLEEALRNIFGVFTPERGRILATTQHALIEHRDKDMKPLGWAEGFDTNVVLGPARHLLRMLRNPDGHAPLRRGWAYVEDEDGTLTEVNLWGDEKDRPFSDIDRARVRTGLGRLAAMMRTGMNPAPALAILAQTMTGEAERVFARLSQASTLSEGASREAHVFEPWTVAMLESGEASGRLEEAVKAIVEVY